jgi:hypothetical protein
MPIEEKKALAEKKMKFFAENINAQLNRIVIDDKEIAQAVEVIINKTKNINDVNEYITEIDNHISLLQQKYINDEFQHQQLLKRMSEEYKGKEYQTVNIENINIATIPYQQLENCFFHYSWKKFLESYDRYGMKPTIGANSEGIDPEVSIFFSKGIEGVLELWDVWLKWRLNRQNNPQYRGNSSKEIQENIKMFLAGTINEKEKKQWYYWMETFINDKYLEDNYILEKLYEFEYNEMLNSDYFIINLKENKEFIYNQIDIKKHWAMENAKKFGRGINPMTLKQYGQYSDFSTEIVDKWNMQTIPGKEILIDSSRIKRVNVNGKNDVYSIIKYMYDLYKKVVAEDRQVKFNILDKYIEYIEQKRLHQDNAQKIIF